MQQASSTRGFGVLEKWLAHLRGYKARRIIQGKIEIVGSTKIVDLGCGIPPVFLHSLGTGDRYGLDLRTGQDTEESTINMMTFDISNNQALPIVLQGADIIVMLASIEHIAPEALAPLLGAIYTTLKPGGIFIATTPTPIAKPVLHTMSLLRLVSPIEITDHKYLYSKNEVKEGLQKSGFSRIETGLFECGMNRWICATK